MLQTLASKEYTVFLDTVPRTIKGALECPPVQELINCGAKLNDLESCLAVEIARASNMLTVGGNLRQGQSVEIARALIADYPGESLQDFCLCLRAGVKGKYGDIFRFDILVVNEWFKKYLEEKYQVVEDQLLNERETGYTKWVPVNQPVTTGQMDKEKKFKELFPKASPAELKELMSLTPDQWIERFNQNIGNTMQSVPDLTENEIKSEGKVKRKSVAKYDNGYTEEFIERKRAIQRAGSEFYRLRTSFKLQTFVVEGNEIMAESESDALEIYQLATKGK
jgi:hypothetical protein